MNCMESIVQVVQLAYRYPVAFTTGLFDPMNPLLKESVIAAGEALPAKVLCVIDDAVVQQNGDLTAAIESYFRSHSSALTLVGPSLTLRGGEVVKNDRAALEAVLQAINERGICRHSYVLAIGGGALLDMVGYAAAIAHRGVRLIRVPTTVLSQDDSGVGIKNGINAYGKKNYLGTFAPPAAVLVDFDFLTSLSQRDWIAGIAEAIKVALLKDKEFFTFIELHASALVNRQMEPMRHVVHRSAQLHLEHIRAGGDPFEMGSSRPLDFGHWAAHKLEALSNYQLRHGEAVAIGVALDSTYSYFRGLLARADWQRILNLFRILGLPFYHKKLCECLCEPDDARSILHGLIEFREHLGGELTVMLLERPGQGTEVHEMDEATIIKSISRLKQIYTSEAGREASNGRFCE